MKTKTIKIGKEDFVIKQLPLRRYADLMGALKNLPKLIGDFDKMTSQEMFEQIPMILQQSYPDLVAILVIATDLKQDDIDSDEFGIKQATEVILAVIEVNDYREVFDQIKKVMARPTPVEATS